MKGGEMAIKCRSKVTQGSRTAQLRRWMRNRCLVASILLLTAFSLRSAALDEPWFSSPGGSWTPDSLLASDMKAALDAKLRPFLLSRGRTTLPAVRYWFQYLGQGSGARKTIEIQGRPFPVPPHPETIAFFRPWISEACIVHARYVPSEGKIEDLVVGGVTCPARI